MKVTFRRALLGIAATFGVVVVVPAIAFATCPGGELNWPKCDLLPPTSTIAPITTAATVPPPTTAPALPSSVAPSSTFPDDTPSVIPAADGTVPAYIPEPRPNVCLLHPYETGETIPAGEWHMIEPGEPYDGTAWVSGQYCARNQIVPETLPSAPTESPGQLPATGGPDTGLIVLCAAGVLAFGFGTRRAARR